MVLKGTVLPLGDIVAMCRDLFSCYNWVGGRGTTGIYWVEARDAAKYPTVKNLAQNVNTARFRNSGLCYYNTKIFIVE